MVPHRKPVDEWKPWPLLTQEQIEESPSFKLGMSFKAERRLRETACIIIWLAGSDAKLTCNRKQADMLKSAEDTEMKV